MGKKPGRENSDEQDSDGMLFKLLPRLLLRLDLRSKDKLRATLSCKKRCASSRRTSFLSGGF